MKIVFATNNAHKLSEVKAVLGDGYELVTLKEVGITDDIPETGDTLDENASLKARYVYERTGLDCFADDTGLEVEALGGAPGVRSARYATDGHDFAANNRKLLKELDGVTNREARFRTVISLIVAGEEIQVEGVVNGVIALSESGSEGFGYDPLFIPEGKEVTFAEMSADEKNSISHRGRAVAELVKVLHKVYK
ncbi:MAG: RdgB/HAM1 family non-canonical purine NTP pyrophosphatase [Alistipes sp.]|nr:RdgB/HAM1 family non-canonical purine NTP pyrophosphatase [Alistipes sp.]